MHLYLLLLLEIYTCNTPYLEAPTPAYNTAALNAKTTGDILHYMATIIHRDSVIYVAFITGKFRGIRTASIIIKDRYVHSQDYKHRYKRLHRQ
jgi:hypothetical protein